jgi:signal transduction histidine kinase/PAS domain-containing protein
MFKSSLLVKSVTFTWLIVIATAGGVALTALYTLSLQLEHSTDRQLTVITATLREDLDDFRVTLETATEWLTQDAALGATLSAGQLDAARARVALPLRLLGVDEIAIVAPDDTVVISALSQSVREVPDQFVSDLAAFRATGVQDVSGFSQSANGLRYRSLRLGDATSSIPVAYVVVATMNLDEDFLNRFKMRTGMDASAFVGNARVLTTLKDRFGNTLTAVGADPGVVEAVIGGGSDLLYWRDLPIGRVRSLAIPLAAPDGTRVGMFSISMRYSDLLNDVRKAVIAAMPVTVVLTVGSLGLMYLAIRQARKPILALADAATRIGGGDLNTPLPIVREIELAPLVSELDAARTRIRSQLEALTNEEARQRAILDGMQDPLIVAAPDGMITAANPAAFVFFGDDFLASGTQVATLMPFLPTTNEPMNSGIHSGTIPDNDGRPRHVEVRRTILPSSNLPTVHIYAVHDVTEHIRLSAQREEMLHNLSHELRTPLAILRTTLEVLEEDLFNLDVEEASNILDTALRASELVSRLTENLLSAGAIQSGRLMPALRPVDLSTIIRSSIEALDLVLQERGQRIEVCSPRDLPEVLADAGYIHQVFVNLLANASKYGKDGDNLEIVIRHPYMDGREVHITIVDHGAGIAPEQQAQLFERFYRAHQPGEQPGVGLGLAIVRGIVEAHGGSVGVTSTLGEGTSVYFTLRLAQKGEEHEDSLG